MPVIPYPKLEHTPAAYQEMVAANPTLSINASQRPTFRLLQF